MKILLVTEYFPPRIFGGGEISAYNLARELAKNSIEVHVLTSKYESLPSIEKKDRFIIHRNLKSGSNPRSLIENLKRSLIFPRSVKKEIKNLDKKEKFDVIHFLNLTSITKIKKTPTIATTNNYTSLCPKANLFYKEKAICSGPNFIKCSNCIANSQYFGKMKNRFYLKYNPLFWVYAYLSFKTKNKKLKSVTKHISVSNFIKSVLEKNDIPKVKVIPNIIEFNNKEEDFDIKEKGLKITYIGSLEKIKGVDLLIKAFNKIDDKEAHLLILGEGQELKRLKKLASDRVKFLGNVPRNYYPSIYKKSDIIALISLWPEPLSRTLIEATYFKKPIIATNTGGNEDVVLENGFLVKPEIESIKDGLNNLIKNEKLREKMSSESKKIYDKKFDKEEIIKKIINIYKSLK